jgi:hypothetical protein
VLHPTDIIIPFCSPLSVHHNSVVATQPSITSAGSAKHLEGTPYTHDERKNELDNLDDDNILQQSGAIAAEGRRYRVLEGVGRVAWRVAHPKCAWLAMIQ